MSGKAQMLYIHNTKHKGVAKREIRGVQRQAAHLRDEGQGAMPALGGQVPVTGDPLRIHREFIAACFNVEGWGA